MDEKYYLIEEDKMFSEKTEIILLIILNIFLLFVLFKTYTHEGPFFLTNGNKLLLNKMLI